MTRDAVGTRLGRLVVRTQGAGPPAVMWHSLFVDDRMWDAFATRVADGRTLISITGPAHGASAPLRARFTLDDCAWAALEVLDAAGIAEPVDWVGCAWGGHVGIVLAATHPERVRTLAASDAPVAALTQPEARSARLAARVLSAVGPVRPMVHGVTAALLSAATLRARPEAAAYVAECLRSADRRALANAIRSVSLSRPDLTGRLSRIVAPTLFVASSDDPLWTPKKCAAVAAMVPRGRAAVVEGSRHLTPFEAAEASADLVHELWASTHSG